jgi:predicted alpha/beta-hydrolase family hydrolase
VSDAPILVDGAADSFATVVLAHGAGAAMDTPFMAEIAALLAQRGMRVVRFEFPYMARRRREGRRMPPDRMPLLEASFREVVGAVRGDAPLIVAGKSMGARVATQLADELDARCAVALGYPFHPPGKPERLRVAHLASLRAPCLIVQGTRDPFGTPAEVAAYPLARSIEVRWIDDADHALSTRAKSGRTSGQILTSVADVVARFARTHAG